MLCLLTVAAEEVGQGRGAAPLTSDLEASPFIWLPDSSNCNRGNDLSKEPTLSMENYGAEETPPTLMPPANGAKSEYLQS